MTSREQGRREGPGQSRQAPRGPGPSRHGGTGGEDARKQAHRSTQGQRAKRSRGESTLAAPVSAAERRRVWGQNFFRSDEPVRRFTAQIDAAKGLPTVEIGPGSGMITKVLAARGEPLTVIEVDGHWARLLDEAMPSHVTVVNEDFLSWRPEMDYFRVVGNLPFGASTEILRTCLGYGPAHFVKGVFLLQAEFARKRAGAWGGNLFNAQWSPWYAFQAGREFSRHCFRPVPKTDTATLFVDSLREPLVLWRERAAYQELVSAMFNTGQLTAGDAARRVNAREPADWLRRSGVYATTRVKDLDAENWAALFHTQQPKRARTGPGGKSGSFGGQGGPGGRAAGRGGGPRRRPRS
ncbi:23S ribosomal RNA methyltransferase Erm [Kocuria palustris]|uniref:23S ribosomal RNA methyltransferase Erm n=1 Tax=Kocuria palustris TaxID=71999 RepID=UPI001F14A4DD|nr:23S ribosomal RNA methyltransferase Erm [Kocuria palustris]